MNNDSITEGEGYETNQKIVKRLKNQARMDRKAAEATMTTITTTTTTASLTPLVANMSAEA
jgi:hypothetical protein